MTAQKRPTKKRKRKKIIKKDPRILFFIFKMSLSGTSRSQWEPKLATKKIQIFKEKNKRNFYLIDKLGKGNENKVRCLEIY